MGNKKRCFVSGTVWGNLMGTVVQSTSVLLQAGKQLWTDTGLTVKTGEILKLSCQGSVIIDAHDGEYAWPEGSYTDRQQPNHVENIGGTLTYADWGGSGRFVVTNTAPTGISMLILPEGATPPTPAAGSVDNGYRITRDYTLGYSLEAGRVWLIFNDVFGAYGNNRGEFSVTITRETDTPLEIDVGTPSPLRYSPPGMKTAKAANEYEAVWMIAIKPLRGPWEGYTEYDLPLSAPAYLDELGNLTPPITYRPVMADLSNIPTSLKLGSEGTDVKILAPQFLQGDYQSPTIFLDRAKLVKQYYVGAYWEMFQVDPRTPMLERECWGAGEIGNSQCDDTTATIELTSFDDMANREVGDVHHIVCQVGTRPGEEFGTQRCRNEILNDGPLRADWTVLATIEKIGWNTLTVSYGALAISGAALHAEFHEHLANGDIEFLDDDDISGINAGYKGVVKSGALALDEDDDLIPGTVDLVLRLSLPELPAIGDQFNLVAGCRRNKSDCQFFDNLPNMQASDLAGQDDLLRRTRV